MNKQLYINLGNLDKDYDKMKYTITNAYKKKCNFVLNIETNNIKNISLYHLYDFGYFLRQLKNEKPYLIKTILKIHNTYVYSLLEHFFLYICNPIANVQIMMYESNELKYIKTFYP
jgi:hypothetical protein|tara:strand:+ start:1619 stop:1966 length:348 start_codon:yes stop_codon:yes gene_type:complete